MFDAITMRALDDPPNPPVPESTTARAMMAAAARAGLQSIVGDDVPVADAEVSDSIYYTLFPNFHPWGGYNRIVYRFRPWQNRFDRSLMECYYLSPFAGDRPDPAPLHFLDEDEPWTDAPELGLLAKVFTRRIVEMNATESDAILRHLTSWASNPRFTVRYHWQEGTIAMWDNRCTQHFVLNDFEGERVIQRVTIMGDKPEGSEPRWEPWIKPGRLSAASRHDRQLHQFLTKGTA